MSLITQHFRERDWAPMSAMMSTNKVPTRSSPEVSASIGTGAAGGAELPEGPTSPMGGGKGSTGGAITRVPHVGANSTKAAVMGMQAQTVQKQE
jgi:hypothetical protein